MPDKRLLGLLAVVLFVYVLIPFPSGKELSSKTWTKTETLQSFQPVQKSGWLLGDNLQGQPHTAPLEDGTGGLAGVEEVSNCKDAIRTYNRVRTGSHTVCAGLVFMRAGGGHGFHSPSHPSSHPSSSSHHTPVCRSVSDYTSVPVWDKKCDYQAWVWVNGMTKTLEGSGDSIPVWPSLIRPPFFRVVRSETFVLHFGEQAFPTTESTYLSHEEGDDISVWRSHAFGVLSLRE